MTRSDPPARAFDTHALNGKLPVAEQRYDVVVIGAGPSGIAAARAAAGRGQVGPAGR